MKVVAAVLAGGSGNRFGGDKALLPIRGKPLWKWSFDRLMAHPMVSGVGIVGSTQNLKHIAPLAEGALFAVEGGSTRQESSRIAILAMPADTEIALVQDAARPFTSDRLIEGVIEAAARTGAAAPGLRVADTVRTVHGDGSTLLDRDSVRLMQTPQAARYAELLRATSDASVEYTEELALLEAIGVKPEIVEGEASNFKITRESDLARIAEVLGPPDSRTGIGYDVHRFSDDSDRPLWLGCVKFEGERGLQGHSDADPLAHAIVDALFGAAGLGDIGTHFPDTSSEWKDRPSSFFLSRAAQMLKERGWSAWNIDATVVAESPRLADRIDEMRRSISLALPLAPDRIGIKATTHEGLGALGRGEGIATFAVATIRQSY